MAIRTRTIYVAGRPELPSGTTRVYLDVEGIPENNFYYLIGLVIDDGKNLTKHSLWAKDQSAEKTIWESFIEIMMSMKDFVLFHYGSYETKFIRYMEKAYGCNEETIAKIRSRSVNILLIIYGKIYFPTYSNDLKSIASCLGFKWSAGDATGLNSILWRHEWEQTGEAIFKQKLLEYNCNDCMGLKTIVENIISLSGERVNPATNGFLTKAVDEIEEERPFGIFKLNNFCFPELENINRCAYFDYQRDKVYARMNPRRRKIIKKEIHEHKMRFRINQIIKVRRSPKCPQCGTYYPYRHANYSRIVYDIKLSSSGIRRWVVKYAYSRFRCKQCNKAFVPPIYRTFTSSKYGPNLMAWVIYQHIGRLKSQHSILEDLEEIFKYRFPITIVGDFKARAAVFSKVAYDELWSALLSGTLLHADETKVNVRGVTNYVWAFANIKSVYYMHTKTREGDFLKEKLRGFNGVLVSDFYAAYDSIKCIQQKCLIHLIRDLNEDILKNPFDHELKDFGKIFTALLTPIIGTIDRYGLKKRHFHKHRKAVQGFFKKLEIKKYDSELARNFQRRFIKYKEKLFTFLDYDGIPWNNNNAEHAIKRFIALRNIINGLSTEESIKEYLVLLSICETLRLNNNSFLKFLLAKRQI